jgi:hypothetical protein
MHGDVAFGVHPEVAEAPAAHVIELFGVLRGPAWGGDSGGDGGLRGAGRIGNCNEVRRWMKAGSPLRVSHAAAPQSQ